MAYQEILTKRKYVLSEVASAFQKAIRRSDVRLAGYWGIELFESGFQGYMWRRLLTVSAEDCAGIITQEIESLQRCWQEAHKKKNGSGRIFAAKAIIILCVQPKSRDADHLTNLIYDRKQLTDEQIEGAITEARENREPIPDYAFDVHTMTGKMRGKTKKEFFVQEHDALEPRQVGLFDADLEKVRAGKINL